MIHRSKANSPQSSPNRLVDSGQKLQSQEEPDCAFDIADDASEGQSISTDNSDDDLDPKQDIASIFYLPVHKLRNNQFGYWFYILIRVAQYCFMVLHSYLIHLFMQQGDEVIGSFIIKDIGMQEYNAVVTALRSQVIFQIILLILSIFVA